MRLEELIAPELKQFKLTRHHEYADPTFLPIYLSGGIGDVIISLDAVRFLSKKMQVVVYTKHIEAFKYFYKDPITVFKDMPFFTWHLDLNTLGKFWFSDSFSGFLLQEHKDLWTQQKNIPNPGLQTILKSHYEKYFIISRFAKEVGETRWSFPLYSLGYKDQEDFLLLPKETPDRCITIHDGYDIQNKSDTRSTKTWTLDHWEFLVNGLNQKYPGYKIIQLGSTTAREIKGVEYCLVNKTTITECFEILSTSSLHIDGDSGLTHAAARMQVPSVVLWGPTPKDFYGYWQNENISSEACSGGCYGLTKTWSDKCPIYDSPKCMDEITPEMVLEKIRPPFIGGPVISFGEAITEVTTPQR